MTRSISEGPKRVSWVRSNRNTHPVIGRSRIIGKIIKTWRVEARVVVHGASDQFTTQSYIVVYFVFKIREAFLTFAFCLQILDIRIRHSAMKSWVVWIDITVEKVSVFSNIVIDIGFAVGILEIQSMGWTKLFLPSSSKSGSTNIIAVETPERATVRGLRSIVTVARTKGMTAGWIFDVRSCQHTDVIAPRLSIRFPTEGVFAHRG